MRYNVQGSIGVRFSAVGTELSGKVHIFKSIYKNIVLKLLELHWINIYQCWALEGLARILFIFKFCRILGDKISLLITIMVIRRLRIRTNWIILLIYLFITLIFSGAGKSTLMSALAYRNPRMILKYNCI